MTADSVPERSHRWLRAIGYGLLAEMTTIITIIAIVMVYRYAVARGQTNDAYDAFGQRVGGIVGMIGGTLYTFLFARSLVRRLSGRFITHGVVLAASAIALSVGGSLAGHQGVPAGYVLASLLKLAAGVLAGFFGARRVPQLAR